MIALGAFLLRLGGDTPPFDDLYHLKRIAYSAAHWPRVLDFDVDRRAFTPWPPLWDLTAGLLSHVVDVRWIAVVVFAVFAGVVAWLYGWVAGVVVGASPYLLSISSYGHLDHHFLEAPLVLAMIVCRRRPVLLGLVMAVALLVQTALIVAVFVLFVLFVVEGIFTTKNTKSTKNAFVIAAVAVLLWRVSRPAGYPDSAWFLGYPHAALLLAAAAALRGYWTIAIAIVLAVPSAIANGLSFFAGDPWLRTIVEFQPMFRDTSRIGTDLANLTGGSVATFLMWRKDRTISLFGIIYLLLSLTSRRFLVVGIPLFAICGAMSGGWVMKVLTVAPPLLYLATTGIQQTNQDHFYRLAREVRSLPPGRVLAPWAYGHAIDVEGKHAVVIDNFGSMPDPIAFGNANDALITTHTSSLLVYCRSRHIRYLVLPHPKAIQSAAASIGVDATRFAKRTVWWRAYRNRERIDGLTLVRDGPIQIWKID